MHFFSLKAEPGLWEKPFLKTLIEQFSLLQGTLQKPIKIFDAKLF